MTPGRALDLGAGEGRHALWLARHGWQVTAVDFSAVGIDRARGQPGADGVDWIVDDVRAWRPVPGRTYDLVLVVYLHLADECSAGRPAWIAPGGALVVVGHALRNLRDGVGRADRMPRLLYEPSARLRARRAERVRQARSSTVRSGIGTRRRAVIRAADRTDGRTLVARRAVGIAGDDVEVSGRWQVRWRTLTTVVACVVRRHRWRPSTSSVRQPPRRDDDVNDSCCSGAIASRPGRSAGRSPPAGWPTASGRTRRPGERRSRRPVGDRESSATSRRTSRTTGCRTRRSTSS